MSISNLAKTILPRQLWPIAIWFYLKSYRVYFASYRLLFRPNARYVAVAEQNYVTYFPPEWTSVSLESADTLVNLECDYKLDLHDIKYAYSAHTIEHLSNDAARRLFKNLFDAMQIGGVLRVECPDLDMLLDDYKCVHDENRKLTKLMLKEVERWDMPKDRGIYDQEHMKILAAIVSYFDRKYNMPLPPLCSAEEFNEKIHTLSNSEFGEWAVSLLSAEQVLNSFEHRNWFNFHKLSTMLTEAGFSSVVKCEPGETRHKFRMNIDRKYRSWYSIYVEAIKN
jgi:hypothetical protein